MVGGGWVNAGVIDAGAGGLSFLTGVGVRTCGVEVMFVTPPLTSVPGADGDSVLSAEHNVSSRCSSINPITRQSYL